MGDKSEKSERKVPSLLHHVFNADSRKVGFGWWLFIVSTALRWHDKIEAVHWLGCAALASVLIGGGTVVDEAIKVLKAWIPLRFGPAAAPSTPAAAAPAAAGTSAPGAPA